MRIARQVSVLPSLLLSSNLNGFWVDARAVTITADRLTAYLRARLDQGAAPATVRNELNALRRAFRLAKRAGRVVGMPEFPSVTIHNARTGFFEEADFQAVHAALAEPLRPVVEFAYLTGWRIPSEVLTLTWELAGRTQELDHGDHLVP